MDKIEQLLDAAGLSQVVSPGDRVAIKTHFGERGNTTHLRPELLRRVVRKVKGYQGKPFVTDTNARTSEYRSDAVSHLVAASEHGFSLGTLGAPVLIADGLDGRDATLLPTRGAWRAEVPIASAIAQADAVVVVNHVTLHPEVGFASALYHLGFGALCREGKLLLCHSPEKALVTSGLDAEREPGGLTLDTVQERVADVLSALHAAKPGKILYCNVLLDITPDPDGVSWSDAAVVPDVGLLVSRDPVGLDQATADFLNMQTGIAGTRLTDVSSSDKIRALHPAIDWAHLLKAAERMGLGSRDYELLII